MKFGQLIEYNNFSKIFFKNHAESEAWRLVPDRFFLFKKALFEVKEVVHNLVLIYFDSPQLGIQ